MVESSALPRRLRVFLCHSSGDKDEVRTLSSRLARPAFHLWLDEIDLLPGQFWQREIQKAVHESDVVLICLSSASINKKGYVQKEIKFALDAADEQPEGTMFLIPVRLENCKVPDRLSDWQWVNLYEANGFERLVTSLQRRAHELGIATEEQPKAGDVNQPTPVHTASHQISQSEPSLPSHSSPSERLTPTERAKRKKRRRWAFKIASIVVISALLIGVIWFLAQGLLSVKSSATSTMHHNLGLTLANDRKYAEAEIQFREALKNNPNSSFIYNDLGQALWSQRKFAEAEAAFRQAIRIDPNYSIAHQGLGQALNELKRYQEAEAAFKEAIRLVPSYAEAHNNLALALFYQERYREAEDHFRRSIQLDSRFPDPYNGLGMTLNKQGRYPQAAAAFKDALNRYNFPPSRNGLGMALMEQNDISGAVAEFREATRLDPNLAEAHYNLGVALLLQGKDENAEVSLRNAVRTDPNYSNTARFHFLLGLSMGRYQQKFAEASDQFRLAAKLNPNDPIAHNALALTLVALNRELEAELAFKEVSRLDPNFVMFKTLDELRDSQLDKRSPHARKPQ